MIQLKLNGYTKKDAQTLRNVLEEGWYSFSCSDDTMRCDICDHAQVCTDIGRAIKFIDEGLDNGKFKD